MNERSNAQLSAMPPQQRNEIVRGALETMIGWKAPGLGDLVEEGEGRTQLSYGWKTKWQVLDKRSGQVVPAITLVPLIDPRGEVWEICVFVSRNGISDYFNEEGLPIDVIEKSLSAKKSVVILDLHGHGGEHPLDKAPLVVSGNGREPWHHSLAYTYGYNLTVFAQRVHGLLMVLTKMEEVASAQGLKLTLYGMKGGAPYAAAARALLGDAVDKMVVDTEGFRFANITSFDDVDMLPGIVKYGDLPAILALSDPETTEVRGEE